MLVKFRAFLPHVSIVALQPTLFHIIFVEGHDTLYST